MTVADEWQALQNQGPDAFDADPSNGEFNQRTNEYVEDPDEAAEDLTRDTLRQGAVPDFLDQGETGSMSFFESNPTLVLAGGIGLLALLAVVSNNA